MRFNSRKPFTFLCLAIAFVSILFNTVYADAGYKTVNIKTGYTICGDSNVTVEQMCKYFNKYGTYPSNIYKSKGAKDIEEFAAIVYEEAETEGVKAEVVFAQICKETGFLAFGGDVKASQCNFCGLGASGSKKEGYTFKNVRMGIRAQVQHLKAYASKKDLVNECVDPRFNLVKRGSARIVEWLGIQENPNHTGWASDRYYGYAMVKYNIRKLINI